MPARRKSQKQSRHPISGTARFTFGKEFLNTYPKYAKWDGGPPYLQLLADVEEAVLQEHLVKLTLLGECINNLWTSETEEILQNVRDSFSNPFKNTNVVILCCKHNCVQVLQYLFHRDKRLIDLCHSSNQPIAPNDEDDEKHNAFYYSIRSGKIQLIEMLIEHWTDNYFVKIPNLLEKLLAEAYDDLRLRNVLLSHEMSVFVEKQLINMRLFSDSDNLEKNISLSHVSERIDLLLMIIDFIIVGYRTAEVDDGCLQALKLIAKNIHILKQLLKSTYNEIPWEEIEFCVIAFIDSYQVKQDIHFLYSLVLTKQNLLLYLETFTQCLQNLKIKLLTSKVSELTKLPILKRNDVINNISKLYAPLSDLYSNYRELRDIHSLETIYKYTNLALSANNQTDEDHLLLLRTLQVIGEYMKNTLESPKLSEHISEFLSCSLTQNSGTILQRVRNSLSHASALSKKAEIEKNVKYNYFSNIQSDIKNINFVLTDILYKSKLSIVVNSLRKISNCTSLNEVKNIVKTFRLVNGMGLQKNIEPLPYHKNNSTCETIENLFKDFKKTLSNTTNFEEICLKEIEEIINFEKGSCMEHDVYSSVRTLMISLYNQTVDNDLREYNVKGIKSRVNETLGKAIPNFNAVGFQNIIVLLQKIRENIISRNKKETEFQLDFIVHTILQFLKIVKWDVKWIEDVQRQINPKQIQRRNASFASHQNEYKAITVGHLREKIQMLKLILQRNIPNMKIPENIQYGFQNMKLQAMLEILLLDIMSILGDSMNCLNENRQLLDDSCPVLIGKSFRNHLAHGNALNDLLHFQSPTTILLNAMALVAHNVVDADRFIGKIISKNITQLKEKYDQAMMIITFQKNMFHALVKGDLETAQNCIKNGADINGRDNNLYTALHFAVMGPNLGAIKLVLSQNISASSKDIYGLTPLHIATEYNRITNVDYLIQNTNICVDDTDNTGKTCLHVAAKNGFIDIVKLLLQNKANSNLKDFKGMSPLHYATKGDYRDIVGILVETERHVDDNEILGGFTALHIAAEFNNLELVKYFLKNKANVNVKTDMCATPLHSAALYGHFSVVEVLISGGADVNTKSVNGSSPLLNAVEYGHKNIVELLLEHGANVNIVGGLNHTPLSFAAIDGDEGMLEKLLTEGADTCSQNTQGFTPLHFAAENGHQNAIHILLKHNASVLAEDYNGHTALHICAQNGHANIVHSLIKSGAKIDAINKNCMTSMHIAAFNGKEDVVEMLIQLGACVNSNDNENKSPLHLSCQEGHTKVTNILIKNNAHINSSDMHKRTPLHYAVMSGVYDTVHAVIAQNADLHLQDLHGYAPIHHAVHYGFKKIVEVLLKNNAAVDIRSKCHETPLHLAVVGEHREITEILLDKGADVNAKDKDNHTLLHKAIKNDSREIASLLISRGIDLHSCGEECLAHAIIARSIDVVRVLLKNMKTININVHGPGDLTLLCIAASMGMKTLVEILVENGADVNRASTCEALTPLHLAARQGYSHIVEFLLLNNADVNVQAADGSTALHVAAVNGHVDVVHALMHKEANINLKDNKNRMCVELAVAHNQMEVVAALIEKGTMNIDYKGSENFTLLHMAAQFGHLEMTKFLVDVGADIHSKNVSGSLPIHIAARDGHIDIVDFYLTNHFNIDSVGAYDQTLLHYAVALGKIEVVKYLITKKVDVNALDVNDMRPIHVASHQGFKEIIIILLENGAYYDAVDIFHRSPCNVAKNSDVASLFISTKELFKAVKQDDYSAVHSCLKAGAVVNVTNSSNYTPMHYAASKGYGKIVEILLKFKANPNVIGKEGSTPLHYACKFSHTNIVKVLLCHGAIYNAMTERQKVPLDFAKDKMIGDLLRMIHNLFMKVQNGNRNVTAALRRIKNDNMIKVIMNVQNTEKKTLLVTAIHYNFPEIENILAIIDGNVSNAAAAGMLDASGKYKEALHVYETILEKRKEILGADNPCTLDIKYKIALILYKMQDYSKALESFEEVLVKQKEILGESNKCTLKTEDSKALALHRQGKNEEALNIFKRVCQRQEEVLGENAEEVLSSKIHIALALSAIGLYDEALSINIEVFEASKEKLGILDHLTLAAENNIAMVLNCQGKKEKALEMFQDVFLKRRTIFGITHPITLKTLRNMSPVFISQQKYENALEIHQEVFEIQKRDLGLDDLQTLNTWCEIAGIYFAQHRWRRSLKIYTEILEHKIKILGPSHSDVLTLMKKMTTIENMLTFIDNERIKIPTQEDVKRVIICGDKKTLENMIKHGLNVNQRDNEGMTYLHYAANSFQKEIVDYLLRKGTDCTIASKKNNTPLHIAASKGYVEIVEILLQHVKITMFNKLHDFVNARTSGSGSTALHISSCFQTVKVLLRCGAMYNVLNNTGKKPVDLSKDLAITNILELIDNLFLGVQNGDPCVVDTLLKLNHNEFIVISNSRNSEGKLLSELAVQNNHHDVAHKVVSILKCPEIFQDTSVLNIVNKLKRIEGESEEESNNNSEICNKIMGAGHSDRIDILWRAEEFMNLSQEIYNYAVMVYKEILKTQAKSCLSIDYIRDNILNTYLSLRELSTCESRGDCGMLIANERVEKIVKETTGGEHGINSRDSEGRTPLHYAVNISQDDVQFLLDNGADCTLVSNKGNTPLHIASSKGHTEIVEIMLKHLKLKGDDKLDDFINKKTVKLGTAALHVAANIKIVKSLLKYGAMYDIVNNEGKSLIDMSQDSAIIDLFKLIDNIFKQVNEGNSQVINKLCSLNNDEINAVINAQNHANKTLSLIAISNQHHNLAYKLIEVKRSLRTSQSSCSLMTNTLIQSDNEVIEVHKHIDELCKYFTGESHTNVWFRTTLHMLRGIFLQNQKNYETSIEVYNKMLERVADPLDILEQTVP